VKKSDKNQNKKDNGTFARRLAMILIFISVVVSVALALAMNRKSLVAFSDSMFLTGVFLFIVSITLNLIKSIYAFMKKEFFSRGQIISRVFLAVGIVNILASIIFAFLA